MDRLKKALLYAALVLLGILASIIGPDLYWLHSQHEAAKTQAAAVALIQNATQQNQDVSTPSNDAKKGGQ